MKDYNQKITIIGAGPAGLSAAIQLARFDVSSTIVDENPNIGGAVFKQPDKGLETSPFRNEKTYVRARELFSAFENYQPSHIDLQLESEVLGDLPLTNELVILQKEEVKRVANQPLIICTGCYERAQPFPGWTLPGIMSVGGIQLQAKCGGVKPGNRVALIGTGPLLMVAAKQLHMAGANVVAVVEAGKRREVAGKVSKLFSNTKLLLEGVSYMAYLKKHKIPFYYGHGIVSASGNNTLKEVVIAPYDSEWKPIKAKAFSLEVDAVGIGYGYVPRTQLTQMLKCTHKYDRNLGGFFPEVDDWQRTSKEGIYTAGDNSGIYGSEVAMYQGKVAALAYLVDIGRISTEEAEKLVTPLRKEMAKLKKFQRALDGFSGLKTGLATLPEADTIICRCEHVKREAIDEAIEAGVEDITALKIRTRVGMGDCQGKMCGSFCNEYLAHHLKHSPEEVGWLNPRFPMAPLPFDSITVNEM